MVFSLIEKPRNTLKMNYCIEVEGNDERLDTLVKSGCRNLFRNYLVQNYSKSNQTKCVPNERQFKMLKLI